MKIRTDFVTNSSSSSFVIAMKNTPSLESIAVALAETTDDWDTTQGSVLRTAQEVEAYILKTYSYDELDIQRFVDTHKDINELYNKMMDAINDGMIIVAKYIGYDAGMLCDFLMNIAEKSQGDIRVLLNED